MKPNPHHWTQVSDICGEDGVGCDGWEYESNGVAVGGPTRCDCPCHGNYAPNFENYEAVKAWHDAPHAFAPKPSPAGQVNCRYCGEDAEHADHKPVKVEVPA